jgi:hypothetical protein
VTVYVPGIEYLILSVIEVDDKGVPPGKLQDLDKTGSPVLVSAKSTV